MFTQSVIVSNMKFKNYIVAIFLIFSIQEYALSQEKATLNLLEQKLCSLQSSLHELRHTFNSSIEDESVYNSYRDSLLLRFEENLKELLTLDSTYQYEYTELQKKDCRIIKSSDNKVRVLTQNTYQGGSNPMLYSYIQYVSGNVNHIQRINENDDPGFEYFTIHPVGDDNNNLYLLSGITLIANCYFSEILQAVSFKQNNLIKPPVFDTDGQYTDNLLISYQYDMSDTTYTETTGNSLFRIIYCDTNKCIYKPIIRLKDGIEYISKEMMIYRKELDGNNRTIFKGCKL